MRFQIKTVPAVAILALAISSPSTRADWTSFRSGGDSKVESELPSHWSAEKGIAWQQELIGYGQSTPVILGDDVFVISVEGLMKDNCVVQCFNLKTGEEKWHHSLEAANKGPSTYSASRAAPTPVVDQTAIYAFFESGDVVALDHAGKQLWHRDLTKDYGQFENNHGLGASPTQTSELVLINVEHKGPSYLVAIDKQTGETRWKVDRGSSSSWASPIVVNHQGKEQAVVSSGGSVTAYDTKTGATAWTIDGIEGNSVPSPTLVGSKLFVGARLPEFAEDGAIRSNCCIDLDKFVDGKPEIVWRAEKAISDYASPVVCDGKSFFVNKAGVLFCLETETGNVLYAERLGTSCWGTPIVAKDLVYFFGKDGKTQVVRAGSAFEVVASNDLWDRANAPKPLTYVESTRGGPEHSEASSEGASSGQAGRPSGSPSGGRGGSQSGSPNGGRGAGMMSALMKGDANGDGILQSDEISADFKPMLVRIDTNVDGSLDQAELKAMADSFAARRADSQSSARDPIVYGAAASDGKIIIRTGTRLYCIQ